MFRHTCRADIEPMGMCGWWPRAVVLDMCIDIWEARWPGRCKGGQVHRLGGRYAGGRLGMRANRRVCVRADGWAGLLSCRQALVRAGRRPLWECMHTGRREVCAPVQACMNVSVHAASVRACARAFRACVLRACVLRACVRACVHACVRACTCACVHARMCVTNLLWSCRDRT